MVAFVSIVLALSLLGLIVYGLHRHQTMEVEYQVDRTMPLPPIGSAERGKKGYRGLDFATSNSPNPSKVRKKAARSKETSRPARKNSTATIAGKADWQQRLADAKGHGDFDQAYEICRQQFPLWSAYNQACITLRAQLKAEKPDAEQQDALMHKLYRTAAIAELLHDKSENAESFRLQQLRSIDLSAVENLDFPYQDLGYAQLRLIRKADVKLMLAAWGRPLSHEYPREHHKSWWEELATRLRNG